MIRAMTYRPAEFWEQRLSSQFDLRGTGETGLSLAYNRACYRLRGEVLERALREAGVELAGKRVLDVGCGTGFFTRFYLEHGAQVTGIDIAPTSIQRLSEQYPGARFILSDVSEVQLAERYDVVNAFDVLYHITDDARWERAVRHLAQALAPGGTLLLTDVVSRRPTFAEHNVMRPLDSYRSLLQAEGLEVLSVRPTHVLLNRELGPWRFLNRAPALLYLVDRTLLALGAGADAHSNHLMLARRPR